MNKILCLLLTVIFLLGCLGAAAEEADPVIIRVGTHEYRLSDAQDYLNRNALELMGMTDTHSLTNEDRQMLMDATTQHFITEAIAEDLIDEYGLRELTEADEIMISRKVRETYDELWQQARTSLTAQYPDRQISDNDITDALSELGYDYAALHEQMTLLEYESKLIELLVPEDKEPTEEEILAFYEENYVRPGREQYEGDIARYEQDVILNGQSSAYVPEGYFYVRYILLDIPAVRETAYNAAEAELREKTETCQAAYNAVADAAILGTEDLTDLRAAYQEAKREQENARAAWEEAERQMLLGADDTVSEIRRKYEAGVSFEDLIRTYSVADDHIENTPGYPYHPDSSMWSDEAKAAINLLEKEGDMSDAVYFPGMGIYIYCRAEDISDHGMLPLTDENRAQIRNYLISLSQMEALQQIIAERAEQTDIWYDNSQVILIY